MTDLMARLSENARAVEQALASRCHTVTALSPLGKDEAIEVLLRAQNHSLMAGASVFAPRWSLRAAVCWAVTGKRPYHLPARSR